MKQELVSSDNYRKDCMIQHSSNSLSCTDVLVITFAAGVFVILAVSLLIVLTVAVASLVMDEISEGRNR
jgi:hypothetical protein